MKQNCNREYPMTLERTEVLGVPVDCVDMAQSLRTVEAMIKDNHPRTVIAINPEKVIAAQKDSKLMQRLHSAGLLIPDGIGVVIAARVLYRKTIERVPGAELMPAICDLAAKKGFRVFLFGASPEVNDKAVDVLQRRYPGIQVAGNQHGYLAEADMPALVDRINSSQADVLFIALGSPKQELWMDRYLGQLNVKVCQGVGGTFDVLAGKVKRAPALFRRLNMEWLYRLLSNPRRLMRQKALPKFAYQVFRAKIAGS
jgi:N-acetylglucosaminyldiphosphoundecaprenol N-acetyl-beta-D-mannosaminyltransferase